MSLPNWIHTRYLALADQYKTDSFGFEEAVSTLQKRFGDKEDQIKLVMSELGKNKFVEIKRSEQDSRKKIYTIVSSSDARDNNKLTRSDIDRVLKKAADLIRTRVDYSFILLLLFYKRFSDQWNVEYRKAYKEAIKDSFSDSEADTEAKKSAYHKINIPEEYLWDSIRKDTLKISENFSHAIKALADTNPTLKETFQQFDFSDFTRNPENNEILRQLVELFSAYSFENVSPDILGDAYEWILRYFAPQKAKEGEVYTPREVIQLMVQLLDPQEGESVYDPAAGSSGMLIAAYKYVEEKHSKAKADSLFLYGQEQNPKTLSLAKMNLLIHDITNGIMVLGDTLRYPKYKEGGSFKKFKYVLANPPWNQDGYGEDTLKTGEFWKDRFSYGFTTKQSADWAWVQHMLASSSKKVAVILDSGAVSRGGRELNIKKLIIDQDLIELVLLLPEKLFYNTPSDGVVVILNKEKKYKNKILLINASTEYIEGKPQNSLSPLHIEKIVTTYRNFEKIDKYSDVLTLEQVKKENYNLSPSRFISVEEETSVRPVGEILSDLQISNKKLNSTEVRLRELEKEVLKVINSAETNSFVSTLGDESLFSIKLGATPRTKEKSYWGGGIKWATPTDLSKLKATHISGTERTLSKTGLENCAASLLPAGSIILSARAPIGYLAITSEEMTFNQGCKGIVIKDKEKILPQYLYYFLKTKVKRMKELGSGSTFKELSQSDLKDIPIEIPSISKQNKIVEILSYIGEIQGMVERNWVLYNELFRATLNMMAKK